VALVRTDVSEEPGASFIRVTKIGELGTTQAATSSRRTLRRNTKVFLRSVRRRRQAPPKRRFLQEPHGVTSQKTPFFKDTAHLKRDVGACSEDSVAFLMSFNVRRRNLTSLTQLPILLFITTWPFDKTFKPCS
jgi:hypothetical protein